MVLTGEVYVAEEVVQDAFVDLHAAWLKLPDRSTDTAVSYLRQSAVNRARDELRHRAAEGQMAPKPPSAKRTAQHGAFTLLERSAVVAALRTLPPRQREALVLRYYGDMSEAQIADIMGISRGAVKSHTVRGMASLRKVLESEPDAKGAQAESASASVGAGRSGRHPVNKDSHPLPELVPVVGPLLEIDTSAPLGSRSNERRPSPGWWRSLAWASKIVLFRKLNWWRWQLVGPKSAFETLVASHEESLTAAWRELEQEIGQFYKELGPPPGFKAGGRNG